MSALTAKREGIGMPGTYTWMGDCCLQHENGQICHICDRDLMEFLMAPEQGEHERHLEPNDVPEKDGGSIPPTESTLTNEIPKLDLTEEDWETIAKVSQGDDG